MAKFTVVIVVANKAYQFENVSGRDPQSLAKSFARKYSATLCALHMFETARVGVINPVSGPVLAALNLA